MGAIRRLALTLLLLPGLAHCTKPREATTSRDTSVGLQASPSDKLQGAEPEPRNPKDDGSPSQTKTTVVRVLVEEAPSPESLSRATRKAVADLDDADGTQVLGVCGFSVHHIRVSAERERLDALGVTFDQLEAALVSMVPAPVAARRSVNRADLSITLESLPHHWDPSEKLSNLEPLLAAHISNEPPVPLSALARVELVEATPHAQSHGEPALFIHVQQAPEQPPLTTRIRRLAEDTPYATFALIPVAESPCSPTPITAF